MMEIGSLVTLPTLAYSSKDKEEEIYAQYELNIYI